MTTDDLWRPDNADGSGWAEVDWVSSVRGSRYHYRHVPESEPDTRPQFYAVVTRLESDELPAPHENRYFVPTNELSDFIMELSLSAGGETIWHIEPCVHPPPDARIDSSSDQDL